MVGRGRGAVAATGMGAWVSGLVLAACSDGTSVPPGDGAPFPTPPDIPWLSEGAPPIAAPDIPWLEEGEPPLAPPDIAWLDAGVPPIDWPCAAGWRPVEPDGARTCEPYPGRGPEACPTGEADFPGEPGCKPVGRECVGGAFPPVDDLPSGARIRYVLRGAPAGGRGTREAPFRSLADALDDAVDGTELVLGAGVHVVDRPWPPNVSVRGRCAAETRLVAAEDVSHGAVLRIRGGRMSARHLQVGPADVQGLRVSSPGTRVDLDGVVVTSTTSRGIGIDTRATLSGRRVVVSGTLVGAGDGRTVGVEATGGATLSLAKVYVADNAEFGVLARDADTDLALTDAAIVDTRSGPERSWGAGIVVTDDAEASAERLFARGNRAFAVGISRADLALREAVIRDTLPEEGDGDPGGLGLYADNGAIVTADRVTIVGNGEAAVLVGGSGTSVEVRDAYIADTRSRESDGHFGNAVAAQRGGSLQLQRALLARNRFYGAGARDAGSAVSLRDVAIIGTLPTEGDGSLGVGLRAEAGASVDAEGVLVEDSHVAGVVASGRSARLLLRDAVVRGTLPDQESSSFGYGWIAFDGATARAERVVLEANTSGIELSGGRLELADVAVRATTAFDSAAGVGVAVSSGGELDGDRVVVDRAGFRGVVVHGTGSRSDLRDLVVRDTRPAPAPLWGGFGISSESGSQVSLTRVLVTGNHGTGVQAIGAGTWLEAADIVIRGTRAAEADVRGGRGLTLGGGATAAVARAIVDQNRKTGVHVEDPGELLLLDAAIRNTLAHTASVEDADGVGLHIGLGRADEARVVAERLLIERNLEFGVIVDGPGSILELSDGVVRDTEPNATDGFWGRGMSVVRGGEARAVRVLLERNHEVAIQVGDLTPDGRRWDPLGGHLSFCDAVIRDTESRAFDGLDGRGPGIVGFATAKLERVLLERNRTLGLWVVGPGASVAGRDVTIREIGPPDCTAASTCPTGITFGISLGVYRGGALDFERFVFEDSDLCGLQIAGTDTVNLTDGIVARHPIAVCLQQEGFDPRTLLDGVQYVDNDAALEPTSFPIPEPLSR